jgi:uncharacterized protein YigA (DUF484 family)
VFEDVRAGVTLLEEQCRELGPLIDRSDWDGFARLLSDMARARHLTMNAFDAGRPHLTPEFENEIKLRVQRVLEYREWHLDRLRKMNDGISERLQLLSRWKSYARSVAAKRSMPANAKLFSDIR